MDFKEWFKKRHTKTGLYEKSLCGDDDSLYIKHEIRKSFEAGQQSKQAEIDALRSHLRTVLDEYYITDYYNPDTCRSAELLLLMPSIYTDDEVKIEIQELLK